MSEQFTVVNSDPARVEELEQVQRRCFPSLAEDEIITARHYAAHIERFAEGQFMVLNEASEIVACSTDFMVNVDFDHIEHRFVEIMDNMWLGNHNPNGEWLYGADIGVVPEYRRRGIATLLYNARRDLIRRLNLRGHVAGGMLSGYGLLKDKMLVEEYVAKVVAGELFDPTVSVQLRRGFHVDGIIQNYVDDPLCDNKAAFIVWHNPDYRAAE
ncbi:MAG: GNAT family N-acetyltransferase [Anaerolineae bacterium]